MRAARSVPLLPSLEHVAVLSDDTGIIQHATQTIPNRSTGYCVDDVARAFIVTLMRLRLSPRDETALRLASTYLSFLHDAQMEDGRFHNFMGYDRRWIDEVGSPDSIGRALWSLGFGMRYAPSAAWRDVCRMLFDRGLPASLGFEYLRSQAYAMIGLNHACAAADDRRYRDAMRRLADALLDAHQRERATDWEWFEPVMTYDNARLPEAMLHAGSALKETRCTQVGLTTLAFYENVTVLDGAFVPIGNDGWYARGGTRALYAQQPLEAVAMIDAQLAAHDATGDERHVAAAETSLAWYYGKNSRSEMIALGGGCYDGLDRETVNRNMGAESTLALLAGAYAMAERQDPARYRPESRPRRIS